MSLLVVAALVRRIGRARAAQVALGAALLAGAGLLALPARLCAEDRAPATADGDRGGATASIMHGLPAGTITCAACHEELAAARAASMAAAIPGGAYSSPTLDAIVGPPSGASRLCLQCHDGSVAAAPGAEIGGDGLANDHPVSFVYDSALAARDGELHDPSRPSGLGGSIREDLLVDGRVECGSCHTFHDDRARNPMLLKLPERRLCLACHDK